MSDTNHTAPIEIRKPTSRRFIDITGQKFNEWRVVEFAGFNAKGKGMWHCECSCGTPRVLNGSALRHKRLKDCGCGQKTALIDKVFGALTIIEYAGTDENHSTLWKCLCECGETCVLGRYEFVRKHAPIRSCGCQSQGHGGTGTRRD
jgi:hypothetical protein